MVIQDFGNAIPAMTQYFTLLNRVIKYVFVYFLDTGNELVINKRQSIEKMVGESMKKSL